MWIAFFWWIENLVKVHDTNFCKSEIKLVLVALNGIIGVVVDSSEECLLFYL
jgi:hypothetical protein